jgi:hypothetical protein
VSDSKEPVKTLSYYDDYGFHRIRCETLDGEDITNDVRGVQFEVVKGYVTAIFTILESDISKISNTGETGQDTPDTA